MIQQAVRHRFNFDVQSYTTIHLQAVRVVCYKWGCLLRPCRRASANPESANLLAE